MSSKARLGLLVIGIAAVVIGILLGRTCNGNHGAADAGVVAAVIDAGSLPVVAVVVDAGEAEPTVVDAGDTGEALELASLPPVNGKNGKRRERAPRERRERVKEPDVPKVADAGVVVAVVQEPVVVDAGQAEPAVVDAGPKKITRPELKEEALPSASLQVSYRDEVSQWLKLVELRVFVNGKRVVDLTSASQLASLAKGGSVLEQKLFPGHHQVRVEAKYVGQSAVFSYLEGYTWRPRRMLVVEVDERQGARVNAVAYDKGAMMAWENRWDLKLSAAK